MDLTGEVFAQRGHGVVVGAHRGDVVGHDEAYVALDVPVGAEADHVLDGHLVLRDRAGLVHAEHVHTGERLDAAHVVDERLFLREAHDAGHEGHACQQVEALGYHAHEGGNCGDYAVGDAAAQPGYLLYGHEHAERDYDYAYDLDQAGEGAHHFALFGRTGLFGLDGQAVCVAVRADVGQPRAADAGHDKAAREEF